MAVAEHMLQAPLQQLGLLRDELVLVVSEPLAMHLDGLKDVLGLCVQLELIVLEDEPNLAFLIHHSTSDNDRWHVSQEFDTVMIICLTSTQE